MTKQQRLFFPQQFVTVDYYEALEKKVQTPVHISTRFDGFSEISFNLNKNINITPEEILFYSKEFFLRNTPFNRQNMYIKQFANGTYEVGPRKHYLYLRYENIPSIEEIIFNEDVNLELAKLLLKKHKNAQVNLLESILTPRDSLHFLDQENSRIYFGFEELPNRYSQHLKSLISNLKNVSPIKGLNIRLHEVNNNEEKKVFYL